MSVPKSLQPAFDGIEPLITDFCNQYLNDEYRELCLHLLEKLCRKRPSPLLAGRKNTSEEPADFSDIYKSFGVEP